MEVRSAREKCAVADLVCDTLDAEVNSTGEAFASNAAVDAKCSAESAVTPVRLKPTANDNSDRSETMNSAMTRDERKLSMNYYFIRSMRFPCPL